MNARLRMVNPDPLQVEEITEEIKKNGSLRSARELEPEAGLLVSDQIAQLREEVRLLRLTLARAERRIIQQELLLRNASVREQELRTELARHL
jgi:hypothetical protein